MFSCHCLYIFYQQIYIIIKRNIFMGWGTLISTIFILFVIILLVIYWFFPLNTIVFDMKPENSNFSLAGTYNQSDMQFYPNMRYPDSSISYKINNCPLQKKNEMETAFDIISEVTVLNFYPVESKERISVSCDDKNIVEAGLFIAGEGGPTKIIAGDRFNVILNGKILLIRESKCEKPNIAIHELLHALGFDHSLNPNNVMFNITKCEQTLGDDIPNLINELYSVPSYADLEFIEISAKMNGKYLDVNMTIKNNGLKDSGEAFIEMYADDKPIKQINLSPIKIGEGKILTLSNVWVPKISVEELKFIINTTFNELEKENNKRILKIKK